MLLSALLLASPSSGTLTSKPPLPACAAKLLTVVTVAPELPPRLHNEFAGRAIVLLVIDEAGHLSGSPLIGSTKWKSVRRSRGQPVGYDHSILAAVSQWRYPHNSESAASRSPSTSDSTDKVRPFGRRDSFRNLCSRRAELCRHSDGRKGFSPRAFRAGAA
ncbi:MAG: hypothetical protein ABWY48_11030 [Pseudoxanthomonas sp.]